MEGYPTSADRGGEGLLAWAEGGEHRQHEDDRQNEDTERKATVTRVDKQKYEPKYKSKYRLHFVGLDRQAVVGGVERLGQRNEVEERRRNSGRDRGQHREGRYTVQENRESEPEKSHGAIYQYSGRPICRSFNPRAGHLLSVSGYADRLGCDACHSGRGQAGDRLGQVDVEDVPKYVARRVDWSGAVFWRFRYGERNQGRCGHADAGGWAGFRGGGG